MKKYFKILSLVLLLTLVSATTNAQKSVGIGTVEPNQNALLHLVSQNNNQGLLLPQLSTQQRESIAATSPSDDGLLVYDTDEQAFYYWHTDQWNNLKTSTDQGTDDQVIDYVDGTITLENGGSIDVSSWDLDSSDDFDGNYNNLANLPELFSGSYNDLNDQPTLFSGNWNDLSGVPSDLLDGDNDTRLSDDEIGAFGYIKNPEDADSDPDNEIQNLELDGTFLNISNGIGVDIGTLFSGGVSGLPDQTDFAGKYLQTNGSVASWSDISVSPSELSQEGASSGQVLKWNGTNWVPGIDFTSESSSFITYHSIDPTSFSPVYSSTGDPSKNNLILFEESGNIVASIFDRDQGETIAAAVVLPHNAEIESISIYCLDRRGPDLTVQFVSKAFGSGTTILGEVSSSGNSTSPQEIIINGPFTVNNQSNTYSIRAIFDIGGATSNDLSDIRHGIYGVSIKYRQP